MMLIGVPETPNGSTIRKHGASRFMSLSIPSRRVVIVASKRPTTTDASEPGGRPCFSDSTKRSRCRALSSRISTKRNFTSALNRLLAAWSFRARSAIIGEPGSPPSYSPGPANPSMKTIRSWVIPRIGSQALR